MDLDEPIIPGDLFVKHWGAREIIWLALPSRQGYKQRWLFLHTGTIHTSYHYERHHLAPGWRGRSKTSTFRYIGTVPMWFLEELTQNTDW